MPCDALPTIYFSLLLLCVQCTRKKPHDPLTRTVSNLTPPTVPPRIDELTCWMNAGRFRRKSSAASAKLVISDEHTVHCEIRADLCSVGRRGCCRMSATIRDFSGGASSRFKEEVLQTDHDRRKIQNLHVVSSASSIRAML